MQREILEIFAGDVEVMEKKETAETKEQELEITHPSHTGKN